MKSRMGRQRPSQNGWALMAKLLVRIAYLLASMIPMTWGRCLPWVAAPTYCCYVKHDSTANTPSLTSWQSFEGRVSG
jgi:hypothetical protein